MWICLNNAFVSAVAIKGNLGQLKVRARNRAHLEELFPNEAIIETPNADYRFRVIVSRKAFADVIHDKAMKIDYGNFKNSVKDKRLHDLYADFWNLHYSYQHRLYP